MDLRGVLESKNIVEDLPLGELVLEHLLVDALSLLVPDLKDEATLVEVLEGCIHDLDLEYREVSCVDRCQVIVAMILDSVLR